MEIKMEIDWKEAEIPLIFKADGKMIDLSENTAITALSTALNDKASTEYVDTQINEKLIGIGNGIEIDMSGNTQITQLKGAKSGWVNAKEKYGLKGDGLTEEADIIKQALTENHMVYFPEGVYLSEKTLFIENDVCIKGDGKNKSIIKFKTNCTMTNGARLMIDFNCKAKIEDIGFLYDVKPGETVTYHDADTEGILVGSTGTDEFKMMRCSVKVQDTEENTCRVNVLWLWTERGNVNNVFLKSNEFCHDSYGTGGTCWFSVHSNTSGTLSNVYVESNYLHIVNSGDFIAFWGNNTGDNVQIRNIYIHDNIIETDNRLDIHGSDACISLFGCTCENVQIYNNIVNIRFGVTSIIGVGNGHNISCYNNSITYNATAREIVLHVFRCKDGYMVPAIIRGNNVKMDVENVGTIFLVTSGAGIVEDNYFNINSSAGITIDYSEFRRNVIQYTIGNSPLNLFANNFSDNICKSENAINMYIPYGRSNMIISGNYLENIGVDVSTPTSNTTLTLYLINNKTNKNINFRGGLIKSAVVKDNIALGYLANFSEATVDNIVRYMANYIIKNNIKKNSEDALILFEI